MIGRRMSLAFPLLFALAACAPLSPRVALSPGVQPDLPSVGDGRALVLTVEDARAGTALGAIPPRGAAPASEAEPLIPVDEVVVRALKDGLTAAGFRVVPKDDGGAPVIAVRVARLEYDLKRAGLSTEITARGELAVAARVGKTTYNKVYAVENGKTWALSPPARGHQDVLNVTLTDLVRAVLTDTKLLSQLAALE